MKKTLFNRVKRSQTSEELTSGLSFFKVLLLIILSINVAYSQGRVERPKYEKGDIILSPSAATPSQPSQAKAPAEPVASNEYLGFAKNWRTDTTFIFGLHGKSWGKTAARIYNELGATYTLLYDAFHPNAENMPRIEILHDTSYLPPKKTENKHGELRNYWVQLMQHDFFQELSKLNKAKGGKGTKIIITPDRSFQMGWEFSGEHYTGVNSRGDVGRLEDTVFHLGWAKYAEDSVNKLRRISPNQSYSFIYGSPMEVSSGGTRERIIAGGPRFLNTTGFFKSQWQESIPDATPINFELRTAIYTDKQSLEKLSTDYVNSDTVSIAKVKVWRRVKLGTDSGSTALWLYSLLSERNITKADYERINVADDSFQITGYLHEIPDTLPNPALITKAKEVKLRDMRTRFSVANKDRTVWSGGNFRYRWDTTMIVYGDSENYKYKGDVNFKSGDKLYTDWQDEDVWGTDSRISLWGNRMKGDEIAPIKRCYDSIINVLKQDSVHFRELKELNTEQSNITYEVYSTNVVPITFMRGIISRKEFFEMYDGGVKARVDSIMNMYSAILY